MSKEKWDLRNVYRKIFYRWIIKKFLGDCNSILDIGCGRGLFLNESIRLNKNASGIDINKKYKRKNIEIKSFKKINRKYDCCFASQFVEHVLLNNFTKYILKNCYKIIIITQKPSKSFWDSYEHIKPYTKKAMEMYLKDNNFKVIFSMNLYPTKSFIVIGEKK